LFGGGGGGSCGGVEGIWMEPFFGSERFVETVRENDGWIAFAAETCFD
jgi:hypothetical protein